MERAKESNEFRVNTEDARLFVGLVKKYLPYAGGEILMKDEPLTKWGFDSMASISLMFDLEEQLGIVFPERLLRPETFSTLTTLWGAVSEIRNERSEEA